MWLRFGIFASILLVVCSRELKSVKDYHAEQNLNEDLTYKDFTGTVFPDHETEETFEIEDWMMMMDEVIENEQVTVQLYYETLCPGCRYFHSKFLPVAIKKLHAYINVTTYPFGNAEITRHENGSVTVDCQHGDLECYGNMLHACAIDILGEKTLTHLLNSCMMDLDKFKYGSDDAAADQCGKDMNIDLKLVKTIKDCAKDERGHKLLVYYGELSKKADFHYVPYVLINGEVWQGNGEEFIRVICSHIKNPPEACKSN